MTIRLSSLFWVLLLPQVSLVTACSEGRRPEQTPRPAEPEFSADLEPFLVSYFATWSRGDMEAYGDHFHHDATIYLVKNGSIVMSQPRDPFVEGQRLIRESSEHPGVERMTKFQADEDRYAATVNAEWELIQGEKRVVGVDRFTLIRDQSKNWKIISLLFYSTGRGRVSNAGGGNIDPNRSGTTKNRE